MSYDFAVLLPESAGRDDRTALEAAIALFERSGAADGGADPRLVEFLAELEAAGAADDQNGWVSVWPLHAAAAGLALPTTYADVDNNLVTLLRMSARHGLILVDLNAETVHRPAPGMPVGVKAGDGTRLGAVTHERLESILNGLPASDPWVVLDRGPEVYVQTLRQEDGTFLLEHRDGSAERHFSTTLPDAREASRRMSAWLTRDPAWDVGIDWDRVQL